MGGYSIFPVRSGKVDFETCIYLTLPQRVELNEAFYDCGVWDTIYAGITEFCTNCLTFFCKKDAFVSALRKTLAFASKTRKLGLQTFLQCAIKTIESWNCDEVYVRDEFYVCTHKFVKTR